MLHVFNRQEEIVATLENGSKDSCPYYAAKVKSVLNGEQVLNFRTTLEHPDAKLIEEHGYIARQNKFKQWQLFLITELIEVHGDNLELEVTAEASFVELDGVFIESQMHDRKTPAVVLPAILSGTRWEVGTISGTEIHDLTIERESALSALQRFRERWGVELTFRIEITGQKVSRRIVDCYIQKGLWTGKRFEYSKDISEVTRNIEAKTIKTALYAVGREVEGGEGLRMDFANVVWVKGTNGAPMDKPLGQKWLGDEAAKAIWGKPLKAGDTTKQHLFGLFDTTENVDAEDLLWKTWVELRKVTTPNITYDVKVVDLYKILGLESEAINLGDTGAVIDKDLDLNIQARVIEYEEDLINEENDQLVLGNFVPRFTDLTNKLEKLEKEAYKAGDTIPTSWIDTQFEFASDAIRLGGGTVIMNEGDGILIIDNVANPQKAIKLNAGQIALANSRNIQTNVFNWRNFGTGAGWLADLVETAHIRFERSQGGTLLLGGVNNGNGNLMVYDSKGNVVADLDASKGGFSNLYVGKLTADNVLNSNSKTLVYIVNPSTGNDNNDGLTSATPLRRLQTAINKIPKHNNGRVEIYVAKATFNEYEVHIDGFYGSGTIYISLSDGQLNGMIYCINNNQFIELEDGYINQIYGTQYLGDGTVTLKNTQRVKIQNFHIYSGRKVDFGIRVNNSYLEVGDCSFYDSTTSGINAERGGVIDIIGQCSGAGSWAGVRAIGTGRIAVHNVNVPTGTVNTEVGSGGEIVGTIASHVAGTPKVLDAPPITNIFPATATRSWNTKIGWNNENNYIYQGEWSDLDENGNKKYYGNWKGCMYFNNSAIATAIQGRTVLSARLKLKRLSFGGYTGQLIADLWTISSTIEQAGVSEPVIDYLIGGGSKFNWSQENWIAIPVWIITALTNGSYGGLCLHTTDGSDYMILEDSAQLEITYK